MIDTHCHIDDPAYQSQLEAFIACQQSEGVEAILVPGIDQTSIDTVLPLATRFPHYLYPALGLHPENVKEDYNDQLNAICQAIHQQQSSDPYGTKGTRLIAIGEIGLDYHFDTTFRLEQHQVLRQQLQWAEDFQLPVMIHSRDATEDTLNILSEFPSVKGVMHCFSGSRETAEQVIRMGYRLGIGGIITFRNCKLKDTLRDLNERGLGLEHLVLETDAPYMAPVPHRGERNESRWMKEVVQVLSEVYGCSNDHINEVTNANARALFALK